MAVEKICKYSNSILNKEAMSLQCMESMCLYIRRVINQVAVVIEA